MSKGKQKRGRGTGSIYKPERSRFWWIAFHQNGKLIRESTESELKTVAQAKLTKRLEEIRTNTFNPDSETITVAEIVQHVFDEYRKSNRPSLSTLKGRWHPEHGAGKGRKGTRTTLRDFFGHLRCNQVTYKLLEQFQVTRIKEGAANGSVNRELNVLKKAFRYALQAGELKQVPPFPTSLIENVCEDFIDDSDYPKFAQTSQEVGGLWLRSLFEAAYTWGNRKKELLKLKVKHVNLMERVVVLSAKETKTKKGRVLPIEDQTLFELIQACTLNKGPEDYVFTRDGKPIKDFRDRWLTVCRLAGKQVRFHALRRSAVTALINAGVPEKEAMAISGHESRTVFARYHIVPPARLRTTMQTLAHKRAENLGHSHIIHTATAVPAQPSDESTTSKSIQ